MKYGLHLPNFGPFSEARLLADFARLAEQAGWHGFFIWDHITRSWLTPVVDPWIALTAIAVNTTTIKIGALITPLPRRRPWKMARETVSLDHLANGRLIFSVGIGSSGGKEAEWQAFGEELEPKIRAEMLDEGLEILNGLWSGNPFSFEGKHYRVNETQFLPTPAQSPRIPVWVGGYWPNKALFRCAVRWDGVFPHLRGNPEDALTQFKALMKFINEQRKSNDPFDVVRIVPAGPNYSPTNTAETVPPFATAGATWWLAELIPQHFGKEWLDEWPLDAMRDYILQGPPAY